jgi:hypothetical protein
MSATDSNILRRVGNIGLNKGTLMANGLNHLVQYDSEDDVLDVSAWFDNETRDELLALSDVEFEETSLQIIICSI